MILKFFFALIFILFAGCANAASQPADVSQMSLIPAGSYVPFVLLSQTKKGEKDKFQLTPVKVSAFYLDRTPVTNENFLLFLQSHPAWLRSKIASVFADSHYLQNWQTDTKLRNPEYKLRPVTEVSWFAAKAYCESQGKTLPTTDQWEYALADQGRGKSRINARILAWYSRPNSESIAKVGASSPNGFGIQDMIGLVWEWTLDFNNILAGDELREEGSKESGIFCGGGSLGKLDSSDYASFMRYSFRTSLKASYTTENLGFRCALEKL